MADSYITLVAIQPSGSIQLEDEIDRNFRTSGMKQGMFAQLRKNTTEAEGLSNGPPLLSPRTLSAVGGALQVTLSWAPVAGAISYNVYWATSPGVTMSSNKLTGISSGYVHGSLSVGQTYYYRLSVVSAAGEGPLGSEQAALVQALNVALTAPLLAPMIYAPITSRSKPTVWNVVLFLGIDARATSYNIYWATAPGVTTASNKISTSSYPYQHNGLLNETTYYYRVSCVGPSGESPLSLEVSVLTNRAYSLVDANTFAAWQFEASPVPDELGNYTLTAQGNSILIANNVPTLGSRQPDVVSTGKSGVTYYGNWGRWELAPVPAGAKTTALQNFFTGDFTIEFWLAFGWNSYGCYDAPDGILSIGDVSTSTSKWFEIGYDYSTGNYLYVAWRDSAGAAIRHNIQVIPTLQNTPWEAHAFRRTWNAGTSKWDWAYFINCVSIASGSDNNAIAGNSSNLNVRIGTVHYSYMKTVTVTMDNLRFSNRARNATELSDFMYI